VIAIDGIQDHQGHSCGPMQAWACRPKDKENDTFGPTHGNIVERCKKGLSECRG